MRVVVRADSSVGIGTGHIMRCLALADSLRARGAEVVFVCRNLLGDSCQQVESKGYRVHRLPLGEKASWQADAEATTNALREAVGVVDWVVVDHYRLDELWERRLRLQARNIMVIDDLADRGHDCDLLLDQNYYDDAVERYSGLLPETCRTFLGPRYALLREEFHAARRALRARDGTVKRLLLFFGGTDPTNETAKALESLVLMGDRDFAVDVIVGNGNPARTSIQETCLHMDGVEYHCQVENMAQFIAGADLALVAGGSSTWERCCLGLPAITVVTAANQIETAIALERAGVIWNLGWHEIVTPAMMAEAIWRGCREPAVLLEMGMGAVEIMGGCDGAGQRALFDTIEQF